MDKYNIKIAHKVLYSPSAKEFCLIDVPALQYIAVDGHGDPNTSPEFTEAVESLYTVAYTLKFASKSLGRDFTVGPLEGLWRSPDMTSFTRRDKNAWDWTMMISQPDWITADMIADAREQATRKKPRPGLSGISFRALTEGRSVQILHIGSYDDEAPTLHRLHDEYLPEKGLTFNGDHHEIYLTDARRTAAAKRKTILRQPVKSQRKPGPPLSAMPDSANARSGDVVIEPMTVIHAVAVLAIYQGGLDTGQASFETSAPDWARFDRERLSDHRFIARQGSSVLGWIACSPVSIRPVYRGVVEHSVYVNASAAGLGIGRLLLDAMLASTDAAGIWTVQSAVFPENAASLALHAAAGFRVVGTRERIGRHHGRWRDVVLIERRSPVANGS